MRYKIRNISEDASHPLFGIKAKEMDVFNSLLTRNENSTQIIQAALQKNQCIGCGKCCSSRPYGYFQGLRVQKDDTLFRLRLKNSKKEIISSKEYDRFSFEGTACSFLDNNLCSIYSDRPGVCRNYPFLYSHIFDSGNDKSLLAKGIVLSKDCPAIEEIKSNSLRAVFLSDIIFPMADAIKHPDKYASANFKELFLSAISSNSDSYYVSPLLGTTLLEVVKNYRSRKGIYHDVDDSPFLMIEGEVFFLI